MIGDLFRRVLAFVHDPLIIDDFGIMAASLIDSMVEQETKLPLDLKRELAEDLNPWFLAWYEADEQDRDTIPWEGFEESYFEWLAQEPPLPRP